MISERWLPLRQGRRACAYCGAPLPKHEKLSFYISQAIGQPGKAQVRRSGLLAPDKTRAERAFHLVSGRVGAPSPAPAIPCKADSSIFFAASSDGGTFSK